MALTELALKRLSKKDTFYEVQDGNGLYVRIWPTGNKSWVFRYTFDGRQLRMTLGRWPGIGLADARQKAGEAMKQVQQGIDPGQLAKEKKAKLKASPTVEQLLNEFYEVELSKKPSGDERKRLIKKDIVPAWGKRKVKDITRRDAVLLIEKVRKRAPVGASRLQSAMVRMWNFAAERGVIDFSPLVGMRRPKEKPKTRVLSNDDIVKLWAGLDIENTDIDIYRPDKTCHQADSADRATAGRNIGHAMERDLTATSGRYRRRRPRTARRTGCHWAAWRWMFSNRRKFIQPTIATSFFSPAINRAML